MGRICIGDLQKSSSPGSVKRVFNRMIPLLGGVEFGERKIEGGSGYYRNISLLSLWAIAPFMHNNAIGYIDDAVALDYSVKGRIKQFEIAFEELMTSDNPAVNPHRPQRITGTTEDMHVTPREDAQGFPPIPVKKGTPVANILSQNPHDPLFMKCDDQVENKGHQFGVDLPAADKKALREFLKML